MASPPCISQIATKAPVYQNGLQPTPSKGCFKNLYTFQVREQRIDDIKGIWTLAILKGGTVTRITEKLIGRVRGFEIRFSNSWYVVRVLLEMPKGLDFVAAVVGQMNQKRKVVPEVVDLEGKPFIQYLHWNQ